MDNLRKGGLFIKDLDSEKGVLGILGIWRRHTFPPKQTQIDTNYLIFKQDFIIFTA
jgi:hypothetical protein